MKCNACGKEIKTIEDYAQKKKCKTCYNDYMAGYREKNRKKINEYSRDWSRDKRWLGGRGNFGYDI